MGWIFLIIAILLEVFATSMMKMLSNGLTMLFPTIAMFVGYIACFVFLALALKTIDVSIAYAIWSAAGIILISIIGMLYFNEHFSYAKLVSILIIVIGVVSLKLSAN